MGDQMESGAVESNGEELFLIEGSVRELQIAHSSINLLSELQKNYQIKQGLAGAALASSDMYGLATNASSLIFYDGEDVNHFACFLGDELVGGTFRAPLSIGNGDQLQAVVSRRGGMCFAHGLLRPADHSAWMPLNIFQGKSALFRDCMQKAGMIGLFAAFLMPFGQFALDWPTSLSVVGVVFTFVFALLFELWIYKDLKCFAERASAIFKVFGFPDPDELDMTNGIVGRTADIHLNSPAVEGSYNYVAVIEKHLEVKRRRELSRERPG